MVAVIALGAVVAPSAFFGLVGFAGWLLLALVAVAALVGCGRGSRFISFTHIYAHTHLNNYLALRVSGFARVSLF